MENAKIIDIDPNVSQRTASNPQESIWVGASAGTGKTKVLTDRVLRLLLPRGDGRAATRVNRILCLTFTKAAANEMAVRINKVLSSWAVMDITDLVIVLNDLLGHTPNKEQLESAQRLFADVVDCPGGLQIMTIHSFCQSVLGRFPLEADLPPNFDLLDDALAGEMMNQAQSCVLERLQSDEYAGSPLGNALNVLASDIDEGGFTNLVRGVCQERHQLSLIFDRYHNADGLYAAICEHYDIAQNMSETDIIVSLCQGGNYDINSLRLAGEALRQDKGKKAPIYGQSILRWLDSSLADRVRLFPEYKETFLKSDGELRSQAFPPKGAIKAYPQCADVLHEEAARLINGQEIIKRAKSAQMTRDLLLIGDAVLKEYVRIKRAQGMLDFDDLIIKTMELFNGNTESLSRLNDTDFGNITPWIMYKMDQGLDHILVDEAQDTNPEQWRIIEALCDEFFSGLSARDDILRTSFTVGDVKQSIYSFQRAAPEEFQHMQGVFDRKINDSGQVNKNVALDISFRSTESVLRVVDNVFSDTDLNDAVGGGEIHHKSFRAGQAGLVEIWPLIEDLKIDKKPFWDLPVCVMNPKSGAAQLAAYTAQNIRNWLDRKEILKSANRPIEAGDIMVLVRSRSTFVDQLVRELKEKDIPVSGVDRMVLGQQLAVQDMFSLAQFCLLPDDDLTLACVLKSPFLGWNEDDLFSLSYHRKGSLWQEICNFDKEKITAIKDHPDSIPCVSEEKSNLAWDYLSRLIGRSRYLGAYEFFSHILNMACPADSHSGLRAVRGRLGDDALDPIDELLNAALDFGRDNVDHLQVFIDHQERKNTEIKREMKEGGSQVRIMTIHGSKGLQAPIVIMPDTIKTSAAKKGGRMLWPNKTNLSVPLYSPRQDDDPQAYKSIYRKCNDLEDQEYYRLLYVAMTRAADRLYIGGYQGSKRALDSSWYFKILDAMNKDDNCEILDNGHIRIENEQISSPDKEKERSVVEGEHIELPDWALSVAPDEPFPPRPLIPSRPSIEDSEATLSPLIASNAQRFRRGNLTHKLLQFLPDFEEGERENAALKFVQKNAQDLSEKVRVSVVSEVMKVLSHPDYAPFFSVDSMAEVSVTGLMSDNRIVSGQIDRLVVSADEIWILDYKTNRPPPRDPRDVPAIYHKQIAAYRDSIREIYPTHKINCALLWTDGPFLTIL